MKPDLLLDFLFPDYFFDGLSTVVDDLSVSNSVPTMKTTNIVLSLEANDEQEAKFSPISCDACRSLHRKCDRTKPQCQPCKQRSIPCHYSTNFKRRAKNIPNRNVAILDLYYNETGYHLISRQELKQFLLNTNKSDQSCHLSVLFD